MTQLDRAGKILEREETLQLAERDARTFLDALEKPPVSNDRLIAALKSHDQLGKC